MNENFSEKLFDPVLVQIYNMEVSEYGRPFVLCRDHVKKLEKRLRKNTQGICQVSIIALLPLDQQCQECYEESKEEQDE